MTYKMFLVLIAQILVHFATLLFMTSRVVARLRRRRSWTGSCPGFKRRMQCKCLLWRCFICLDTGGIKCNQWDGLRHEQCSEGYVGGKGVYFLLQVFVPNSRAFLWGVRVASVVSCSISHLPNASRDLSTPGPLFCCPGTTTTTAGLHTQMRGVNTRTPKITPFRGCLTLNCSYFRQNSNTLKMSLHLKQKWK